MIDPQELRSVEALVYQLMGRVEALEARCAALEQQGWQAAGGYDGGSSAGGALRYAVAGGGGIAAASGGFAGSGTVTLYDINPSTGALTGIVTATAFNAFPASVPAAGQLYVGNQVNSDGSTCLVVPSLYCP